MKNLLKLAFKLFMKLNYHISKASPFWNGSSNIFRKFIIFQVLFMQRNKGFKDLGGPSRHHLGTWGFLHAVYKGV